MTQPFRVIRQQGPLVVCTRNPRLHSRSTGPKLGRAVLRNATGSRTCGGEADQSGSLAISFYVDVFRAITRLTLKRAPASCAAPKA